MKNKNIDCVYYFFNQPQKQIQKKKKNIYKTVAFDFFVENELTNLTKLLTVEDRKTRFYLCEDFSNLKIAEVDTDIDSEFINLGNNKSNQSILLVFDNLQLTYLKNFLKSLKPSKYVNQIIYFYKYLLNTLSLLVSSHLFHNHILFDSIVVSEEGYPLLTNFSLSIDYMRSNIDTYFKHFILDYEPGFTEMPLEMHIVSYLLTNKLSSLSSYNIESVINDFADKNNILRTFGPDVVSSYKQEAHEYYKKYINQSYQYILTDMIQYAHTWDNYALSILFLRILIGLHHTINIKNKFIIYFMKLLVGNIHLAPFKRLTITETLTQFDSILEQMDPKDYTDIIEHLSCN
jgi:hypothetical protein